MDLLNKTCGICSVSMDSSLFFKSKNTTSGFSIYCKSCYAIRYKSKDRARRYMLKQKYNITHDEYLSMFYQQGGVCDICQEPKDDELCVDHCHESGTVRGLLCHKCNKALGLFKDNLASLKRALNYIKKHKTK
jgi:hypothetical protein